MSFDEIPVLDISLARDPATKPQFLKELRKTLIEVGFLYISNTGLSDELIEQVVDNGQAFFKLPMEVRLMFANRERFWLTHAGEIEVSNEE